MILQHLQHILYMSSIYDQILQNLTRYWRTVSLYICAKYNSWGSYNFESWMQMDLDISVQPEHQKPWLQGGKYFMIPYIVTNMFVLYF